MHRLPALEIPKHRFTDGKIRRYLEDYLKTISSDENFSGLKLTTTAEPGSRNDVLDRAEWVANIPATTFFTSWTALERATATLSELAVNLGWYFFMPGKRSLIENSWVERFSLNEEIEQAGKELLKMCDDESIYNDGYLHDIGARGRREEYLAWARRPEGYALGVRLSWANRRGIEQQPNGFAIIGNILPIQ